jgi:O-antigen ligase
VSRDRKSWQKNLQLITLAVSTAMLPFSTFLCHAAITIFLILWLIEGSWAHKLQIVKGSLILQCILGLFVLQCIGIAYSDYKSSGWSELEKQTLLVLAPIAIATTSNSLSQFEVRLLLKVFVVTCVMAALICIANATAQLFDINVTASKVGYLNSAFEDARLIPRTWLYFSYVNLAAAINIHPAYLALYIAFAIVLVLFDFVSSKDMSYKKQIFYISIALFLCGFEIFLATRIIIITLLLLIAFGSVLLFLRKYKLKFSLTGVSIIVIAIVILRLNPVSYYRNVQEISKSNFDIESNSVYKTSAEIRASLWWLAWKAYGNTNPIIGSGTGSVKAKIEEQSDRYRITNVLDSFDPHNQFLYFLIENGVVGLLAFVACLLVPMNISIVEKDYLFLGFGVLCGAFFMTESALELQKGISFIAIMYSLLAFQRRSYQFHQLKLNRLSVRN